MGGVFTLQKLANLAHQGIVPLEELLAKYLPARYFAQLCFPSSAPFYLHSEPSIGYLKLCLQLFIKFRGLHSRYWQR